MSPEKPATIILDGLEAGNREIVVAEGIELSALSMRAANPEMLFAFAAKEGARLAAERDKAGPGASLDTISIDAAT